MIPDLAKHSEKLFYFFEIANEGSLQSAGRKLGVSPSSLSYSLKELEGVLKVVIFKRTTKGVEITPEGQLLFRFCQRYFRDMNELTEEILHSKNAVKQKIRVGTFQSIALYFWPLIQQEINNNPNVSISITTARSRQILEALIKREVDVAITVETVEHPKIVKLLLYSDEYAFYGPKNLKDELLLNEIKKMKILLMPDACDQNSKTLLQYLDAWKLVFEERLELDSFEIIADFIERGYGIGILPSRVAKTHKASIKQLAIENVNQHAFGFHRFFMSYRNDLELKQSIMDSLINAAKLAAQGSTSNEVGRTLFCNESTAPIGIY